MSSHGGRSSSKGGKEGTMFQRNQIKRLQEELAKTRREKEYAEKALARKTGKKGVPLAIPLSEEVREQVEYVVGTELWRTCKFLASEDQLSEATLLVMEQIHSANRLLPEEYRDHQDPEVAPIVGNFKNTYGTVITSKLNAKRNSSQSGIMNEYMKRKQKGLPVPTPAELWRVVQRKGLFKDPGLKEGDDGFLSDEDQKRNWSFFQWYWDHLLPKVCGKIHWGSSKRHYGCISSMTFPNNSRKKYVTTKDEALVVLIYENCGQRMPYVAQCKATGEEIDKTHEKYQSKYTSSDEGQIKWGGWDCVGRARFIKMTDALKTAKKRPHVKKVEEEMLLRLQEVNNLCANAKPDKDAAGPEIFENDPKYHVKFGVESGDEDEEELDEGDTSELEDFDEQYRVTPKPKGKKKSKKRGSLSQPVYQSPSKKTASGQGSPASSPESTSN